MSVCVRSVARPTVVAFEKGGDILSHTNFTLHTVSLTTPQAISLEVDSRSNQGGTCQCWFGGDADHRPYHDHLDAFCAFRHDHDRH